MRICFLATILFLIGCNTQPVTEEKPIARAFDQYLYLSDIADLLVDAKSREDSFNIIQSYTQKWAKHITLMELAKKNLPSELLDLSKEIEDYKKSLIIYRYQQAYIAQNLDTNISEKEIDEYYQQYQQELILDEPIVKAFMIQVPRTFNKLQRLKNIYTSEKPNDIKEIDEICNKHAYQCNDFKNDWISFEKLLNIISLEIRNKSEFLKTNKTIEQYDSNFVYLAHIKNYKLPGEIMPKEWGAKYVVIPNILLKRKLKLLEDLENKSLNDFINKNKIEFFYP